MIGTRIVVAGPLARRGVHEAIIVSGTPKPGVVMEIVPSTAAVAGVFTYAVYGTQAYSSGQYVNNDGDRKAIAVLLEKNDEGKTWDDAYADGDRATVYYPAMGEKLNMWFNDVSGTGDDFKIGEEMMVEDGTGQLLSADDNAEAHPFTCLETVKNPTADHIELCRFNGEGGA